ncbi:MAG: prolyl oligopeptidase family serine peptidase [Verrucomicrobiaceae bacterium]
MKKRNLSPQKMFSGMVARRSPRRQFRGGFEAWKAAAKPEVLATLGANPEPVAPDAELTVEWEDRGIVKRRYLIDVGPDLAVALQVNIPQGLPPGERRPALLCWHGHGPCGKEPVMGNAGSAEVCSQIELHNYDYGQQMAGHGFITFGIDLIGFGELSDRRKHHLSQGEGRDWCNLYYLHATMLGMSSLSINLAHGRAATDFVCSLPEVDPERLGVMGLSGGGTMTLWSALTDERFKAAEIICYGGLWARFGIHDINYCGMQVAPGLFDLVDLPDLQGLLAPMPLLVDIGAYDSCFAADDSMECYRQVAGIYESAGAADRLHLDLFPGDHAWGGRKSRAFFGKYLGDPVPRK